MYLAAGHVTQTITRNIGKLGRRVPIEFLMIKYKEGCKVDLQLSFSIGYNHGIGISVLCSYFLCEINIMPLEKSTHIYYMENG
jgi:hypothetical protein